MRSAHIASVLCFGIAAGHASAAPHPHSPGDGVVRLRSATFLSGWGYDEDSKRVDDGSFAASTASAHVEAGVAPRLTLALMLPYVFIPAREAPSAGDLVVGGLLSVLEDDAPVDLALSLDVKLPLYAGEPTTRGRDAAGIPALGDGQVDVTAAGVLVATLPLGGAMDLYAGYRLRTNGVTDAAIGGGRIGVWLLDRRFFVSALLDTVVSFDADPASREVVGRGYAALGPRISVRVVDRSFLDVSALYVGRGKNAAGGVELGFGLSTSF